MSEIRETERTLDSRGSGKPDYETEVFRANTAKKFRVKGNESLKMFQVCMSETSSPWPWVVTPLGAGETRSLIDVETGLAMPYTSPADYELEVIMIWLSVDQRIRMNCSLDGYLAGEYYLAADTIYYENEVKEFSTADIDPGFIRSHLLQLYGTNLGAADMHGYSKVVAVLREHGSERPTTKTVRCRHCEYEEVVPLETTELICPKCDETTLFMYFPWGGDLR